MQSSMLPSSFLNSNKRTREHSPSKIPFSVYMGDKAPRAAHKNTHTVQYLHCDLKNEIAFEERKWMSKMQTTRTCPGPLAAWSHLFKQSHNPFIVWNNICPDTSLSPHEHH